MTAASHLVPFSRAFCRAGNVLVSRRFPWRDPEAWELGDAGPPGVPRASARPACARLCPREVAGTARGEGTAQGGPPRPPRRHTPGNAPSQLAFPGRLPGPPWGVPGRRSQPGSFIAPRVTTNSPAFAAPPRRLVRAPAFSWLFPASSHCIACCHL